VQSLPVHSRGPPGKPHELIARYLAAEAVPENATRDLAIHPGRVGRSLPIMQRVSLRAQSGLSASAIRMGEGLTIHVEFAGERRFRPNINVCVKNYFGVPVFTVSTRVQKKFQISETVSAGAIICHLRELPLLEGTYSIDLFLGEEYACLDGIYDAISFEVLPADVFDSGQMPLSSEGTIYWPAEFEIIPAREAVTSRG
jgi:lipopolysaccharide transport system ATP-binding protein